ncbi:MAG: cyclodeaminase/cyclohydrolase family protein [Ktedonobacterales bacterium]
MAGEQTVGEFLESLGSSAPAPGGGAASALAGALAAALAEMVAQLTVGRPRFAAVEDPMRSLLAEARAARVELLALAGDDARVYAAVSAAYKLPKATEEETGHRDDAIQAALRDAMQPPLRMMAAGCRVLALAEETAASGNPSVASDAGCAALLGEAAVRAAGLNVLANVVLLRDEDAVAEARAAKERYEEAAASLRERTMAAVHARMGG